MSAFVHFWAHPAPSIDPPIGPSRRLQPAGDCVAAQQLDNGGRQISSEGCKWAEAAAEHTERTQSLEICRGYFYIVVVHIVLLLRRL